MNINRADSFFSNKNFYSKEQANKPSKLLKRKKSNERPEESVRKRVEKRMQELVEDDSLYEELLERIGIYSRFPLLFFGFIGNVC